MTFHWSIVVDMQPYSLDLRQKVFDAYQAGGISQRQLARNFGVSLSFVQDLLKQYRDRSSLAPKIRTQQTPTKLNAEQLEVLRLLVEEQPDATLEELRDRLHEQTQVFVGVATVDRMVRLKLGFTVKKKSTPQQKRH